MKNTKKPWTESEVTKLVELWSKKHLKITELAKLLDRSAAVVRAKVSALRSSRPDLATKLPYRLEFPQGKLRANDISKIRKDKRPLRLIGLDYGVTAVTIFKVKNGETWKDA